MSFFKNYLTVHITQNKWLTTFFLLINEVVKLINEIYIK
jgi:hypothetical protein